MPSRNALALAASSLALALAILLPIANSAQDDGRGEGGPPSRPGGERIAHPSGLEPGGGAPPAPSILGISLCTWRQFDQGGVVGGGVELLARASDGVGRPPPNRWEFAVLDAETGRMTALREVGARGFPEAATTLVGLDFGVQYRAIARAGNPSFGPWSEPVRFVAAKSDRDC
jgi:hypothetical protein